MLLDIALQSGIYTLQILFLTDVEKCRLLRGLSFLSYLFHKGEFLEELFEWVLLFLSRFYLFYGLEILRPLRPVPLLWWVGGGGGGGAYFGVCCAQVLTNASDKFLMGTQNHEFLIPIASY